jgi:hypothetical protein
MIATVNTTIKTIAIADPRGQFGGFERVNRRCSRFPK